jgi:hypothetical protein
MGRSDLKHIDRGVVYIPVNDHTSDLDKIIEEHKHHTVVLLRSGQYNIKNILTELIKTTLNT